MQEEELDSRRKGPTSGGAGSGVRMQGETQAGSLCRVFLWERSRSLGASQAMDGHDFLVCDLASPARLAVFISMIVSSG